MIKKSPGRLKKAKFFAKNNSFGRKANLLRTVPVYKEKDSTTFSRALVAWQEQ